MSNQLYGRGRNAFATGDLDWVGDTIKMQLIDLAAYTLSIDVNDFLNDIPAGARIGSAITLTGKAAVLGVCDGNDVTVPTVTGATVEALVLYRDTGVESTSNLIAYIDNATGLPVTPGGGDIVIVWDNGANKIFKL